jgi:hypothetical protein
MQQLVSLAPLRPAQLSSRALIRIHGVEETDIVALDTLASEIGRDTVCSQNIRGVERAQNRSAVVIGCEIGPRGDIGIDARRGVEEETAGENEYYVAEERGDALVLGVDLVECTGVVG